MNIQSLNDRAVSPFVQPVRASFFFTLMGWCVLMLVLPELSHGAGRDRERVIIDTDIGIDIDDAFAIALALRSPELEILGFSTASGDTLVRAKILDRMLGETGFQNIPVAVGAATTSPSDDLPATLLGLQRRYGENGRYAKQSHRNAVDFMIEQIKRYPGEVTLIAIGPLSNVADLIDKDVATFRKVKRLVIMAGWIAPIFNRLGEKSEPGPEYNVKVDIGAAQKVFKEAGVPIYIAPFDSTIHLSLDEIDRKVLFSEATPLTDSLALLYILWGQTTPVLFDAMAVAYVTDPKLCPMKPMRIVIDDRGFTRVDEGLPNAQACLHSDPHAFMDYFVRRVRNRAAGAE